MIMKWLQEITVSIRKKIVMIVMMEKKKASWKSLLEVHFKSHLGQLTGE